MTYNVSTCRYLAWCSALLEYGIGWLAHYQDNVTECKIESWCWRPNLSVGQHYEVPMNVPVISLICMTLDLARV